MDENRGRDWLHVFAIWRWPPDAWAALAMIGLVGMLVTLPTWMTIITLSIHGF
jgi:hypothetical protein